VPDHRLVIGPGGSGRSFTLQQWAETDLEGRTSATLTGSILRPPDENAMTEALADQPDVLVVDDLQWCTEAALQLLVDNLAKVTIWASRRPWPRTPLLRLFDDALTEVRAADRLGPLDIDDIAPLIAGDGGRAAGGELVERIHAATGGSPALAVDAAASGWGGDVANIPEALIDAVIRRVERSGDAATELVRVLVVDHEIELGDAAKALPDNVDADEAQRGIRAGGLVDSDGHVLPLIAAAVLSDLTTGAVEAIHDRLAVVLGVKSPEKADEHLLAGSAETAEAGLALLGSAVRLRTSDPARALDLLHQAEGTGVDASELGAVKAEALFHLGSPEAAVQLDLLGTGANERSLLVSFGLDLRDLRWSAAADRALEGDLGACLIALAAAAQGRLDVTLPDLPSTPLLELVARLGSSITELARGELAAALGGLAISCDDFDRLRPDIPLGGTPHLLAALASILSGDLLAADDLLSLAAENLSGGPGEQTAHRNLLAYARMLDGRYSDALVAVRAGEGQGWAQRDRFLLAALDAGLARRSGDTARLREAWRRADPVLVRHSPSWLLLDPLTELLAAGARLGHMTRVQPIVDVVLEQCQSLPAAGPAPVGGAWLELQLALSVDDLEAVASKAGALADMQSSDRRSLARIAAGRVWTAIATKSADEADVTDVARQLADVGEPWDASRMVGQAALDSSDAQAARRLLEQARTFVVEPSDLAGEDGLVALGLSEREADVAKLVAEGRTHKEVGAQLYISPKTVEHHVAKIRQKLGAGTRAELLATIREAAG
jgi:DNA-binding NarL/FixJ family response regulator